MAVPGRHERQQYGEHLGAERHPEGERLVPGQARGVETAGERAREPGQRSPAWASVSSLFMIGARPSTRERGSVPSHSEKFLISGYGGRGGEDLLGEIMAGGLTSLTGLWQQMGVHLEWMRRHDATAEHPVGFYGIDLGGQNASLIPALDAVLAYLAQADSGWQIDPAVRETAMAFAATSAFAAPATLDLYAQLAVGDEGRSDGGPRRPPRAYAGPAPGVHPVHHRREVRARSAIHAPPAHPGFDQLP